MTALGIIEGFLWQTVVVDCPGPDHCVSGAARFYFYAPKADAFLRERWREDHPRASAQQLRGGGQVPRAGRPDLSLFQDIGLDRLGTAAEGLRGAIRQSIRPRGRSSPGWTVRTGSRAHR